MPSPFEYAEDQQHVVDVVDDLWDSDPVTAERLEDLLDLLSRDHTDPRVRARAWRPDGWGFTARGPSGSYTVIWRIDTTGGATRVFAAAVIRDL